MKNCCFSSWRKTHPVFDSEWHWSVWHQQLLHWRHKWLLFKQASELSRLALQFITLLAFSKQSWRGKSAFALHMSLKISKCTTYPSPRSKSLLGSQKSWLSLLTSSQAAFSPRLAMTTAIRAMLYCHHLATRTSFRLPVFHAYLWKTVCKEAARKEVEDCWSLF